MSIDNAMAAYAYYGITTPEDEAAAGELESEGEMTEEQAEHIVKVFNVIQNGAYITNNSQVLKDAESIIADYNKRRFKTTFYAAMIKAKAAFIMRVANEEEKRPE